MQLAKLRRRKILEISFKVVLLTGVVYCYFHFTNGPFWPMTSVTPTKTRKPAAVHNKNRVYDNKTNKDKQDSPTTKNNTIGVSSVKSPLPFSAHLKIESVGVRQRVVHVIVENSGENLLGKMVAGIKLPSGIRVIDHKDFAKKKTKSGDVWLTLFHNLAIGQSDEKLIILAANQDTDFCVKVRIKARKYTKNLEATISFRSGSR